MQSKFANRNLFLISQLLSLFVGIVGGSFKKIFAIIYIFEIFNHNYTISPGPPYILKKLSESRTDPIDGLAHCPGLDPAIASFQCFGGAPKSPLEIRPPAPASLPVHTLLEPGTERS